MTISINVGDFRHRIEIQESTTTRGTQGTQVDTFATVATRWGSVAENQDEQFIVMLRYYEGLAPTARKVLDANSAKIPVNRLKHGTRILNIQSVMDKGARKQVVRVVCTRDDETF